MIKKNVHLFFSVILGLPEKARLRLGLYLSMEEDAISAGHFFFIFFGVPLYG
jgi:hypothetical protein